MSTTLRLTDTDYKAEPLQQQVHNSTARVKCIEAGRRGMKSRTAVWELIKVFKWLSEQVRPSTLVPNIHMWVLGPNFRQCRQAWMELNAFIPESLVLHRSEVDLSLMLQGNCLVEVQSAHDPDNLQTVGLDFLWVTEADNVPDGAWYNIAPALGSGGRAGLVVAEGRPYRAHSWFEALGIQGRNPDNDDVAYFHWTSMQSKYCDHKQMELDRLTWPERRWRMEYLAERTESERGAFRNIRECIKGALEEPIGGHVYDIGYDVGITNNPSVLIVMDVNRRRVVAHLRLRSQSTVVQKETAIAMSKKWNGAPIFMDSGGAGVGIFHELRNSGEVEVKGVQFGASAKDRHSPGINMKEKMYTDLIVALERETVSYPDIPELITELQSVEVTSEDGAQHQQFSAPEGQNDDYVAAFALALHGCNSPSGGGASHQKVLTTFRREEVGWREKRMLNLLTRSR